VIRRALLLALALLLGSAVVAPLSDAEANSDLERVRENIAEIRSRISSVASERSRTARRLIETEEAISAAEADVAAAGEEMAVVRILLDESETKLADVQAALVQQLEKLASTRQLQVDAREQAQDWVLEAYMSGGPVQPSVAFDAAVVSDVSVGVMYLEVLSEHSSAVADQYDVLIAEEIEIEADIRQSEADVLEEIAGIESLTERYLAAEAAAQAKQEELELAYEELETTVAALESEIEQFEGELAAFQKEESSIRSAIAAAAADQVVSNQAPTGSGQLVRPVPGRVSSGFGMRVHPITGQNRMHNGLDMDGAMGDPIKAAKGGTVILSGVKGGYGNTVMIDHGGGMVTLYAHQSKIGVANGESVSAGQVIGYVGSTGQSTGPHLHFEVRINGQPTDPARYL
jgi:murein DD-endopeptidase MepM/ murein hydrolase activator NlpD